MQRQDLRGHARGPWCALVIAIRHAPSVAHTHVNLVCPSSLTTRVRCRPARFIAAATRRLSMATKLAWSKSTPPAREDGEAMIASAGCRRGRRGGEDGGAPLYARLRLSAAEGAAAAAVAAVAAAWMEIVIAEATVAAVLTDDVNTI